MLKNFVENLTCEFTLVRLVACDCVMRYVVAAQCQPARQVVSALLGPALQGDPPETQQAAEGPAQGEPGLHREQSVAPGLVCTHMRL